MVRACNGRCSGWFSAYGEEGWMVLIPFWMAIVDEGYGAFVFSSLNRGGSQVLSSQHSM